MPLNFLPGYRRSSARDWARLRRPWIATFGVILSAVALLAGGVLGLLGVPASVTLLSEHVQSRDGHSYSIQLPRLRGTKWLLEPRADSQDSPTRSDLALFEDEVALGPPHETHNKIAGLGAGRFSHWDGGLIFSSSDNTDPRINGRSYHATIRLYLPTWISASLLGFAALLAGVACHRITGNRCLLVDPTASVGWRHVKVMAKNVLIEAAPVVFVAGAALAIFAFLVSLLPEAHRVRSTITDTSSAIVYEQVLRSRQRVDADILFLGDSACLMGLDMEANLLSTKGLGARSLCSIGYVGPRGYAAMLKNYRLTSAEVESIVIALHPASLQRLPDWDHWADFTERGGPQVGSRSSFREQLDGILRSIDKAILSKVVFKAEKGAIGFYYGTIDQAANGVANTGTMIDPSRGLSSRNELATLPFRKGGQCSRQSWESGPTEDFLASLSHLAEEIAKLPDTVTFLAPMPLPESCLTNADQERLAGWYVDIAARLGMPAEHVLRTPLSLPDELFSTVTHVNRHGRKFLTERVVEQVSLRSRHLAKP